MTKNKEIVEEILRARERVYHVGPATPLEEVKLDNIDASVFLKREDLSPINAYKWRGAYNRMTMLTAEEKSKPVIAASAGNHAQGVALSARMLGIQAKIYMPLSTPKMKQTSVKKHGQDNVEIILTGDSYSDTAAAALQKVEEENCAFIHPFDNIYTIAGQATIADEVILSGKGPFDIAFVQIGGGGIAAGIATWLKIHYPDIKVIGVEGEDQACMKAAIAAGEPITLDQVDTFCDGTAVKRAGDLTFEICRDVLDDIITVSNEEVSAAIETTWSIGRFIPEPSGALGLAGLMKYSADNPGAIKDKKLLAFICGANMDFSKLRLIAGKHAIGSRRQKYLRLSLTEQSGSLLGLIKNYFADVNITGFLYGKRSQTKAWPVICFEDTPEKLQALTKRLDDDGYEYTDVTEQDHLRYQIINYNPSLFKNPLFLHIHFAERKGALKELLEATSPVANICYFNYTYTGEEIGRALIGFEFEDVAKHQDFIELVNQKSKSCRPVEQNAFEQIIYSER